MSAASALLLVAAIVSAEGGVAVIDQGSIQGLRPGDEGHVFYALIVNGRAQRIDAGSARVLDANDSTASVQAAPGTGLRPAYEIEFKLPSSRVVQAPVDTAPVESGSTAERVSEPGVGEGLAPSRGVDAGLALAPQPSDSTNPAPPIEAAEPSRRPLRRPAPLPAEAPAPEPGRDSVLIPAGTYSVGRELLSAEFFNQTPRFDLQTGAVSIDRRPVTVEQYVRAGHSPVGDQVSVEPVRAVTWFEAEAYCLSVGGRLPSESEWEIAVQLTVVESPSGLVEWTGSWYSPYPGNAHPEESYGESFRVLRGAPLGVTFDPHARRFMAPEQRNSSVGFRCALPEGAR